MDESAISKENPPLRRISVTPRPLPSVIIDTYQKLGGIQSFLGKPQEAQNSYQHAVAMADDLWQRKPDDVSRKRILAINYAGLGELELDNFETDKAVENFRSGLRVFGSDPTDDEEHDRMLIRLHWYLGGGLDELGSQSEAITNLRKSIDIAERLVQKSPSSARARRTLSVVYGAVIGPLAGEEMLNVGESAEAHLYARKALAIDEASAAGDSTNVQARYDLASSYQQMGDSFRSTQPETASKWYRRAISVTQQMTDRREARNWLSQMDDALAAVLVQKGQAQERLHLLQEANALRQELAKTGLNGPRYRILLMRSYCELSGVELAIGNLAQAREAVSSALPLLAEFNLTAPSLLILRDLGLCYTSIGAVQQQLAMDRSTPISQRLAARADARHWYLKSAAVWNEWNRRGAATPESEIERRKVEHLLGNARPGASAHVASSE